MALSIMKIVSAGAILIVVVAALSTLLTDFTIPGSSQGSLNTSCDSACFANISRNLSGSFYNSSLNPFIKTSNKSIGLSNNLTASSQAVGFAFAFLPNDLGNMLVSIVQSSKLLVIFVQISIQNLGLVIGGSSSLTNLVVSTVFGLLVFYISLAFLSSWIKYPLA